MHWLIIKYLTTSAVVVLISEVAKRSDRLGGLIASLPLVTILALLWLNFESQPISKIANHAYYTFWYVIPTLPMFLAFPWLLERLNFWWTMLIFVLGTVVIFWVYALIMKKFGIELL